MASAVRQTGVLRIRRPSPNGWALLAIPGIVFLGLFFAYPLAEMVARSFGAPWSQTYGLFSHPLYIRTLGTTFEIAALVALVTLLLGYPFAYVMAHAPTAVAVLLGVLVLLPIWMSFLVRTYAWQVWLEDTGVINSTLKNVGLINQPLPLIRNLLGVVIGMTQILLPFMVLPLYTVMRRIDRELTRAAASLGASPTRAFVRVFLPLSLPGITAGTLLVFVLALGFFVAPVLLGGPTNTTLSSLIFDQVETEGNFGAGSALGVVLLLATLLVLALGARFVRLRSVVTMADE
jgi:putative spermidine/putrescine transport system permease protein